MLATGSGMTSWRPDHERERSQSAGTPTGSYRKGKEAWGKSLGIDEQRSLLFIGRARDKGRQRRKMIAIGETSFVSLVSLSHPYIKKRKEKENAQITIAQMTPLSHPGKA